MSNKSRRGGMRFFPMPGRRPERFERPERARQRTQPTGSPGAPDGELTPDDLATAARALATAAAELEATAATWRGAGATPNAAMRAAMATQVIILDAMQALERLAELGAHVAPGGSAHRG